VSHFGARIIIYNEVFSIIEMRQPIRKVRKIDQKMGNAEALKEIVRFQICPANGLIVKDGD